MRGKKGETIYPLRSFEMARRGKRITEWTKLVSKTFRAGKVNDKEYSLKDAMKDASRLRRGGSTCRGGNNDGAAPAPADPVVSSSGTASASLGANAKSEETKPAEAKSEETKPSEAKSEETKPDNVVPNESAPKELDATHDANNLSTATEPSASVGGRRGRRRGRSGYRKRRGGGSTKRYSARSRAKTRTRSSRNFW